MRQGIYKSFRKAWKSNIDKFNKFTDTVSSLKDVNELTDADIEEILGNGFTFIGTDKKIIESVVSDVERECYQAMEGFVHNLNTLHSRAGSQTPFSSINLGTDTTNAGRMVTKNLLLAMEAGLGHGETCIFPIVIFLVKEGFNYNPEDKNHDLLQLAYRVTGKRLFPKHVGAA